MALLAGCAGRRHAARGAGEHRIDDDALARPEVPDVVEQVGDHLVAEHERHRHEGGEIEAGAPGQGVEVGTADARHPRCQADPTTARRLGVPAVDVAQRRQGTGQQAGHPGAKRPGPQVLRDRPVHFQAHRHARGVPFLFTLCCEFRNEMRKEAKARVTT